MSLQKVLIISHIRRYISTTITNHRINSVKREGKFMKKLIYGEIPRKCHPAKDRGSGQIITSTVTNLTGPHVSRRAIVLNKLFMKHITDLMATGEISDEISGSGIEISRVNVTNDYKLIKVFWFSSNCNADELNKIDRILHDWAYKIRHELSQLKVIGVVPPIRFFKDNQLTNAVEIEKILSIADYGDDFTLTTEVGRQSQLTLVTRLPENSREKILNRDTDETSENADDNEKYNVDLPSMSHNVLGLDHWKIMSKVKQSLMRRGETAKNRMNNASLTEIQQPFMSPESDALRSQEDTDAFNAFLLSRQIAEKKRKKLPQERFEHDFEIGRQLVDDEDTYYQDDTELYNANNDDVDDDSTDDDCDFLD